MTDKRLFESLKTQAALQLFKAANAVPGADAVPPLQGGLGQGLRLADGDYFAVRSGMNQVRRAGVVGCDDGQTAGQRLSHH